MTSGMVTESARMTAAAESGGRRLVVTGTK